MKLWPAFALCIACTAKPGAADPPHPAAPAKPAPVPPARTGDAILDEYLRVAQALAVDSTAGIDEAAAKLEVAAKARGSRDEDVDLARAASALLGKGLADARKAFGTLSQAVIRYRARSPQARDKTVLVHCPMAKASWLQTSKEIKNPYYGAEMSTCGTIVLAPTWADVQPAFSRQCARCHGPDADAGSARKRKRVKEAQEHLNMSVFPFRSHHPDVLVRIEEALTRGKDDKITMPADEPDMGDDADVALILAWVRGGGLGPDGAPAAFEAPAPTGSHHGH